MQALVDMINSHGSDLCFWHNSGPARDQYDYHDGTNYTAPVKDRGTLIQLEQPGSDLSNYALDEFNVTGMDEAYEKEQRNLISLNNKLYFVDRYVNNIAKDRFPLDCFGSNGYMEAIAALLKHSQQANKLVDNSGLALLPRNVVKLAELFSQDGIYCMELRFDRENDGLVLVKCGDYVNVLSRYYHHHYKMYTVAQFQIVWLQLHSRNSAEVYVAFENLFGSKPYNPLELVCIETCEYFTTAIGYEQLAAYYQEMIRPFFANRRECKTIDALIDLYKD